MIVHSFWSKATKSILYQAVKEAGKCSDPAILSLILVNSEMARRGFWDFVLDEQDFNQWTPACKKALIKIAWKEGFATIPEHPRAINLTVGITAGVISFLFFLSAAIIAPTTAIVLILLSFFSAIISTVIFFENNDGDLGKVLYSLAS